YVVTRAAVQRVVAPEAHENVVDQACSGDVAVEGFTRGGAIDDVHGQVGELETLDVADRVASVENGLLGHALDVVAEDIRFVGGRRRVVDIEAVVRIDAEAIVHTQVGKHRCVDVACLVAV